MGKFLYDLFSLHKGKLNSKRAELKMNLNTKTNKYYIKYYLFFDLQLLKLIKNIFYLINVIRKISFYIAIKFFICYNKNIIIH